MEYIVGKPKIKIAVGKVMGYIILAILLMILSPYEGMNIFGYIVIVISIVIVLPGISYCELMWRVDKNVLQYTYYDNMIVKISAFFRHIFKDHKLAYQITLNIKQIDYIAVTYAKLPRPPFGAYGYDIIFEIHMLDGSIYSFISLPLMNRKAFNEAVGFMQKQNIKFVDKYEILPALHQEQPISYYLEQMEKENLHD